MDWRILGRSDESSLLSSRKTQQQGRGKKETEECTHALRPETGKRPITQLKNDRRHYHNHELAHNNERQIEISQTLASSRWSMGPWATLSCKTLPKRCLAPLNVGKKLGSRILVSPLHFGGVLFLCLLFLLCLCLGPHAFYTPLPLPSFSLWWPGALGPTLFSRWMDPPSSPSRYFGQNYKGRVEGEQKRKEEVFLVWNSTTTPGEGDFRAHENM